MGKNKRQQFEAVDRIHSRNILVDSREELDMLAWLCEAVESGLVSDFEYQPDPIKLSDSVEFVNSRGKKRSLFREHIYTPDFIVKFKPGAFEQLDLWFKVPFDQMCQNEFKAYIDVKGGFMSNGSGRSFSINQKWIYQLTGIYIQKVVPKDFFRKCGCPAASFITRKTGKSRKMFQGYRSIRQTFGLS